MSARVSWPGPGWLLSCPFCTLHTQLVTPRWAASPEAHTNPDINIILQLICYNVTIIVTWHQQPHTDTLPGTTPAVTRLPRLLPDPARATDT